MRNQAVAAFVAAGITAVVAVLGEWLRRVSNQSERLDKKATRIDAKAEELQAKLERYIEQLEKRNVAADERYSRIEAECEELKVKLEACEVLIGELQAELREARRWPGKGEVG